MIEEKRFDFWWWDVWFFFFPLSFFRAHPGVARRWAILGRFHSQRKPNRGCCSTRGKSQAASLGVYACVCRASDGCENESELSRHFFPLCSPFSRGGAVHAWRVHPTAPFPLPTPASQPTPNLLTKFPLWRFWVGTVLCNWSLWALSTHSTVGWTERPLRRQLLGHPGQAGRSGRRRWEGWRPCCRNALTPPLRLKPSPPLPPLLSRTPLVGAQSARQWKYTAGRPFCDVFAHKATWFKKEKERNSSNRVRNPEGQQQPIFTWLLKETLHFMKRAAIFWHTVVVWTAVVFLCHLFIFFPQQSVKDKDTHSFNDMWTLCTENKWLPPIKLNWWKSPAVFRIQASVLVGAAWFWIRLLHSLD